jgi:hypothetical protein
MKLKQTQNLRLHRPNCKNRLDPLAQEVMQALAVYGAPVPAVAVDYLLQPYRIGIDSSKTLGRLVNMQFVRGECAGARASSM